MDVIKIKLSEILEDLGNKNYPDLGRELFSQLVEFVIDRKCEVIIDMEGVDSVPSMFLNTSIYSFYEVYGEKRLKQIKFTNMMKSFSKRLQDYVNIMRSKNTPAEKPSNSYICREEE